MVPRRGAIPCLALILVAVAVILPGCRSEVGALPASPGHAAASDVDRFVARRDACDHFRGEDPFDAARRRYLTRKLTKTCTGSDAELARLRAKYRDDRGVIARLSGYEDQAE